VVGLSNAEATKSLPVALEATVTYVRPSDKNLFVMDGGYGCYVRFEKNIGLMSGDRIAVTGMTAPSFRPIITAAQVRFLSHGSLPTPKPAKFEDLIQGKLDSQYVVLSGHVLSAALDLDHPTKSMRIRVRVPDGIVEGIVADAGDLQPENLIEGDIQMTGVAGGEYDGKMQLAGMWVNMNSWRDVLILHPPVVEPWTLPAVPLDQVISSYRFSNESLRVRVIGTLTYYEPGALAVVEQDGKTMLLKTSYASPLSVGSGVEATGFPRVEDGSVHLEDAQLRPFPGPLPVKPPTIRWENASAGQFAYNLVAMEGEVVGVVQDSRVDLLILKSDGYLFSATMRHRSSEAPASSIGAVIPAVGTRVLVTGVCFMDTGNHWRDRLWFDLRMRSLDDITVLQPPSWWTVKHMAYVTTLLSAAILFAVVWAGLLDRRLRRQTVLLAKQSQEDAIRERTLARQEQHRSQILEFISSSDPLDDVLREIASMVSSRLLGARCWFELNSNVAGVHEENHSPEHAPDSSSKDGLDRTSESRTVSQSLFAPDGTNLGVLRAAPPPRIAQSEIDAAMIAGARLAELAIDTRRLYTDLRRRSEFDLLTDIPNRFSMENSLDQLMLTTSQDDGIFGLIYVDLDDFKQVNDSFGHRTGDLYLQAVTRRMKFQLRNGDILARIGGDEFIALVPILRSRTDAEEIATRLDRCFDEPFELEGLRLQGSASIGLAVFPDDGTTKEELQRSADAAMYAHKQGKRLRDGLDETMQRVGGEDSER
jgi:diguanylate cyclase (GGDEF)-like protein